MKNKIYVYFGLVYFTHGVNAATSAVQNESNPYWERIERKDKKLQQQEKFTSAGIWKVDPKTGEMQEIKPRRGSSKRSAKTTEYFSDDSGSATIGDDAKAYKKLPKWKDLEEMHKKEEWTKAREFNDQRLKEQEKQGWWNTVKSWFRRGPK